MNASRQFAAEVGYRGDSPAMLRAFEEIRQHGIREAREHHMALLKRCRSLHCLHMFAASIHPARSVGEALEDAKAFIRRYRRMQTWMQQRRYVQMVETKERIVVLRYFRRYGKLIWREAA